MEYKESWRDECLKWCYSRVEDGKYGDQKYLEQFEKLSNNVYVIQNRGLLGSWDVSLYQLKDSRLIYNGQEYPFVFFHMSGTRFSLVKRNLRLEAPGHTRNARTLIIDNHISKC